MQEDHIMDLLMKTLLLMVLLATILILKEILLMDPGISVMGQ